MYDENSPILKSQPTQIDVESFIDEAVGGGAKHPHEVADYVATMVAIAGQLGIDPVVMLAQWAHETAWGTSEAWEVGLNPAGLGLTKPGAYRTNPNAQKWSSGRQAAYAQAAHMAAYLWGSGATTHWQSSWPTINIIDKRYQAPIDAGYRASTLLDLNGTWAIDPEDNYHGKLAADANQIERNHVIETEAPMAELVFGRVPHPDYERFLIRKDAGHGHYMQVGARKNVGCVHHEWMDSGTESEQFYKGFFACPSGYRHVNALVDYFIMRSGKIVMINDPKGTRVPWASGGSGPYQGDGGPFVRKFGTQAVNARLVSWEYCKRDNDNLTPAQIQSGGALAAYWHDQDEQRWDEHPFTSKYGLVTSLLHHEVQGTTCGEDMYDDISKVQAVTRGVMKKWQQEGDGEPNPPDVEPFPPPSIPGGITEAQAKELFGQLTRFNLDGTTQGGLGFDPDGPISNTWAHRAAVEQVWPKAEKWYVLDDSGEKFQIVTFANDWRLVMASERSGWEWVDYKKIVATP